MATGFRDRLRDACIAAGVSGSEDLARRCGVTPERVREWLESEGEALSLREAMALKRVLGKRPEYLIDGGTNAVSVRQISGIGEAIAIAEKLSTARLARWCAMGRKLTQQP